MNQDTLLTFDLNGVRVRKEKPPADGPLLWDEVLPFTIVCDSREQIPYAFDGMMMVVPTVVKGLASGDYSIKGMEDRIAIERKSLDDLYGSVTWGRDRFEREIERLNDLAAGGFAAVMVEATWQEVMNPLQHRPGWINQTEPRSVEGTIISWTLRYPRVHWWLCGDRRGAECRTFSVLRKFWKAAEAAGGDNGR